MTSALVWPGNTKGRSSTVELTSCLTCSDKSVSQTDTKIVNCHTADSKPVKQEVNRTVILPPLVFHGLTYTCWRIVCLIDICVYWSPFCPNLVFQVDGRSHLGFVPKFLAHGSWIFWNMSDVYYFLFLVLIFLFMIHSVHLNVNVCNSRSDFS